MFGSVAVGFLAGIGVAAWAYAHALRRTGGNNQSAMTAGAIAGVFTFVIVATLVVTLDSMLGN